MKKQYQKPLLEVIHIKTENVILAASMEGGEIGGGTDRFDAPKYYYLLEMLEEEEEEDDKRKRKSSSY